MAALTPMCDNRTMDWLEVGSRIAEARQEAGLSQAELAADLAWERTRLTKVERGVQRLTALDLLAVADALGRRMDWFVLPRAEAVTSYRGKLTGEWEASTLGGRVEAIAADVAAVAALTELPGTHSRPTACSLSSLRDAEEAASQTRRHCGLDHDQPAAGISDRLARGGLLVFAAEMGDSAEDAAYLPVPGVAIALVNSSRKPGRRRLAAAHELGHHVCGDGFRTDRSLDSEGDDHERRLDRFGRAFLLPETGLVSRWEEAATRFDRRTASILLAAHFEVDMATLATRLHRDLGAVDQHTATEIRETVTRRGDMIEHGLRNPEDLAGTWLPPVYQRAVLAAYRAEDISGERAADLLQGTISRDDLPPLQPLPARRGWDFVS